MALSPAQPARCRLRTSICQSARLCTSVWSNVTTCRHTQSLPTTTSHAQGHGILEKSQVRMKTTGRVSNRYDTKRAALLHVGPQLQHRSLHGSSTPPFSTPCSQVNTHHVGREASAACPRVHQSSVHLTAFHLAAGAASAAAAAGPPAQTARGAAFAATSSRSDSCVREQQLCGRCMLRACRRC